ncbi:MAG: ankyrin repeat domain-containing protein [Chitinispirillales bacterium]|jgi:ankyrin repeat protein|nr:ankyrin repeat domain-containing protein [Chitinispirillales bacterium]
MQNTTFISSKPKNWETPFPTIGEAIRAVANVLETKGNNPKDYDRLARGEFFDYEAIKRLWYDAFNILEILKFGKIEEAINYESEKLWIDYIEILKGGLSCGYSREDVMKIFNRKSARIIYSSIGSILEGQNELLHKLIVSDKPVQLAFEWKYYEAWEKFRKIPPLGRNDIKENVYRWMIGEQTPTMENLFEVVERFCDQHEEEKDAIYKVFFCAKIIYNITQYPQVLEELRNINKCDIVTLGEWFGESLEKTLYESCGYKRHTEANHKRVAKYFTEYEQVRDELCKKTHKSTDKEKFNKQLKKVEKTTNDLQDLRISWWNTQSLRARWYVLSGEWDLALKCYGEIIDEIFYTGDISNRIFSEALVLAAIRGNRPFLKKLKHYGVVFGLFGEPYTNGFNFKYSQANKDFRSKDFVVEDSEVRSWASRFYDIFPKDSFFISEDDLPKSVKSPFNICYVKGDVPEIVDIKNKNKIINLQGIKYPQLVWFTLQRDIQAIKDLLKAGADVNKLSSSGDSALLLAIREMDITVVPGPPPEERNIEFFEVLSKHHHTKKTLEILTNKHHHSVLGSAVETGNPQIVNNVLEMMLKEKANVDIKYSGDKMTPLYIAINLFKKGERLRNPQREMIPATFEFMRRVGTIPGITTAEAERNYAKIMENPIVAQATKWTEEILSERYEEAHPKENLVEIIEALLEAGSNPNEPHYLEGGILGGALRGYTPLMMAAEIDFVEAFELLVKYGGEMDKQCQSIRKGTIEPKPLDCWYIVQERKSNNVLKYMQENCKNKGKIFIY